MIHWLVDALSWLALAGGGFFVLVGGIGLLRFPDLGTRLHPAGITDTLGAALILLGLILQAGLSLVSAKLLLIFLFLLVTAPTSTHALARAAFLCPYSAIRLEDTPPSKS